MLACATKQTLPEIVSVRNLFLPVPDTDFRDFLHEIENLAKFAPEIIGAIESDLDAHAREKKLMRLADRKYFESQTGDLPALDIKERNLLAKELQLAAGRPRMPGMTTILENVNLVSHATRELMFNKQIEFII